MIRPYRDGDTADIIEAWYEASRLAHPFLSEDFLELEAARIRDIYLPKAQTWVYEDRGRVAGFISLIGSEVGAIFLRPSMHGRGHGRALMDKAASLCDTLELDVFEANDIGRRFYARYGFAPVGRSLHDGTGQSMIRLRYHRNSESP